MFSIYTYFCPIITDSIVLSAKENLSSFYLHLRVPNMQKVKKVFTSNACLVYNWPNDPFDPFHQIGSHPFFYLGKPLKQVVIQPNNHPIQIPPPVCALPGIWWQNIFLHWLVTKLFSYTDWNLVTKCVYNVQVNVQIQIKSVMCTSIWGLVVDVQVEAKVVSLTKIRKQCFCVSKALIRIW